MVAIDMSTYTNEAALAEVLSGQVAGIPSWNGVVDPTKPLQLVWCHERCHKQESDARRRAISQAAHDSGAVLICVKKATKFAAWLAEGQRQPCVLLTDWREAKPCLETAALQPLANRPVATVVLCEQGQQFKRASAWTQTVAPELGLVHVCQEAGPENNILTELLACLLRAAASSAGLSVSEKAAIPGSAPVPLQHPATPALAPAQGAVAKSGVSPTHSELWDLRMYDQSMVSSNKWGSAWAGTDAERSKQEEPSHWVPGAVLRKEAALTPTFCGNAMALTPSMVQVLSSIYAAKAGLEKEQFMDLWGTASGFGF
jgi:hypothetical protein